MFRCLSGTCRLACCQSDNGYGGSYKRVSRYKNGKGDYRTVITFYFLDAHNVIPNIVKNHIGWDGIICDIFCPFCVTVVQVLEI